VAGLGFHGGKDAFPFLSPLPSPIPPLPLSHRLPFPPFPFHLPPAGYPIWEFADYLPELILPLTVLPSPSPLLPSLPSLSFSFPAFPFHPFPSYSIPFPPLPPLKLGYRVWGSTLSSNSGVRPLTDF